MKKSVCVRARVGIAAVTTVGVVAIVTAATASAQLSISSSPSYCVGATYTITLPAADAASLIAQHTGSAPAIDFLAKPTAGGYTEFIAEVPYVAGQDVTAQWTPRVAETWNIIVRSAGAPNGVATEGPMPVNVVDSASCAPATGGNPPSPGWGSSNSPFGS